MPKFSSANYYKFVRTIVNLLRDVTSSSTAWPCCMGTSFIQELQRYGISKGYSAFRIQFFLDGIDKIANCHSFL